MKRCKYSIDAAGIDLFPDLFVSWPMARIQKDEAAAALSHTGRAGGKRQNKKKKKKYYWAATTICRQKYKLSPKYSYHGPKWRQREEKWLGF